MSKVRGKGSLVQLERDKSRSRCRKWELRVNIGKDPATGTYKPMTRRVEGTYTQAQKQLRDFIAEIEAGDIMRKADCTLEEYSKWYVERREAEGAISPASIEKYRYHLKAVNMHLGKANISDVTPMMISDCFIKLAEGKSPSGKKLRGSSLASINSSLHSVFKRAKRDGLIASNPMELVDPPKSDTKERKALTRAQANAFAGKLDAASPYGMAMILCLFQGLRISEAVNLEWRDIVGMSLSVTKSKTRKGIRTMPVLSTTAEALETRRKAQRANLEWLGIEPWPGLHVVTTFDGTPIGTNGMQEWWRRHRVEYGMEGWTFHEMRHSFATFLAESGASPKEMQDLLGHESPLTSLKIYTHVHDEARVKAMSNLDGFLNNS